ncbi:hypothetical protein [Xenorhabdus sp. PB30.3]|uniref:hypothetical protein n=1 Tax=Xenorhabdus sp. PB30.3 TaxID=2788941 RepID=UPI001E3F773A|nr:hypothetical protein [Xenorhabdus sp. PB30.3]MCC8380007.1 hypothetical protein [Xenorhabdus sp. PB30.3]
MNKEELKKLLKENKISSSYYSLEGGTPDHRICLTYKNGYWLVYYAERGSQCGIESFEKEDDACQKLWEYANNMKMASEYK